MSKILFGSKVDLLTVATPSNGYIIAYDNDGILKQKSALGVISNIGSSGTVSTLYTGNGTISSNRIVNLNSNNLNFTNANQFKITSNTSTILDTDGVFHITSTSAANIEIVSGTNGIARATYANGTIKMVNSVGINMEPDTTSSLAIYSTSSNTSLKINSYQTAVVIISDTGTGISSTGYSYGGMFVCSSGVTQSYAINALGQNGSGGILTNGPCRFINNDDPGSNPSHFYTGYGTSASNILLRFQNGFANNAFDVYGDRTARFYSDLRIDGKVRTNTISTSGDTDLITWNGYRLRLLNQLAFPDIPVGNVGLSTDDVYLESDGSGNYFIKIKG